MRTRTKALMAGGVATVVLATGGVAVAATATPTTTAGHGHRVGTDRGSFSRIEHGQFVSRDKAGAQVTHDIVNGTVTAVSATSVSVEDGSGTLTTFAIDSKTRVHSQGQAKGTRSPISAVKTGGDVTVLGTGTGPFTATSVRVH